MTTLEDALNRNSEIIALSIGLKCACTCDKNCGRLATVMDPCHTPLCDECSKVPPKYYSNGASLVCERHASGQARAKAGDSTERRAMTIFMRRYKCGFRLTWRDRAAICWHLLRENVARLLRGYDR